jgi:guanyl-specific ribonuclease Sa
VDETGAAYAYAGGDPVNQTDPSGLGDGGGECNDQPDTCEGVGQGGVNLLNPADQYYNATNAADETEEENELEQEQQSIAEQEQAQAEQAIEAQGPTGTGQECLLSREGVGVNFNDAAEAKEEPAWITPGSLPSAEEAALDDTIGNIDTDTVPTDATATRWGIDFENRNEDLPPGDYLEYRVQPPPGVKGAGPLRVVVNEETGSMYYTWTHYGDNGYPPFVRIR